MTNRLEKEEKEVPPAQVARYNLDKGTDSPNLVNLSLEIISLI